MTWHAHGVVLKTMMLQDGNKVAQVHKRFFKLHWFMMESCCEVQLPRERREYKHGKTIALHKVRPVTTVVYQGTTCALHLVAHVFKEYLGTGVTTSGNRIL
jgi:hypothetical protein